MSRVAVPHYFYIVAVACAGGVTGYTIVTVGKIVPLIVGGGILLTELAMEIHLINIDWASFIQPQEQVQGQIRALRNSRSLELAHANLLERTKEILANNIGFGMAFLGGVFVGIGCA